MDKNKKTVVIGSGLGGLSAAIYAANAGFEVTLFEKTDTWGGKAGEIKSNGFRFDTGPSLLTMPFVLEDLFNYCGKDINDYLEFVKLDVLNKYFWDDGTTITAWSNLNKLADELYHILGTDTSALLKYLEYSKKIYELTAELFLFKGINQLSTIFSKQALSTLLQINKIDSMRSMHSANSSYFKNPKLIQLFDRYATYNGSNPFKAPATLNIIQHVEYNLGGYSVKGGIRSVSNALYKLAKETGVNFQFDSEVKEITTSYSNITGIRLHDDTWHPFSNVISNSDVKLTYNNLLRDSSGGMAKRYNKIEPSSSALVFYWGINRQFPDLEAHNIFFSNNYKNEFTEIFDHKVCPTEPTVYIYISQKLNNKDAPEGMENWFVMINAPYSNGQNWDEQIVQARKNIVVKIDSILNTSIEENIVYEQILSPIDIERKTCSSGGSLYGISSNNKMAAFLRQPNKSSKYKGLYFTGGSAHPGGGIPLVLLSGKIATDMLKKDYGVK